MPELKVKHGSVTSPGGVRYGIGIHTVTGDEATWAGTFAGANPDRAEYSGTTFAAGAARVTYGDPINQARLLQPEIGGIITRQQKNQAKYELKRQTKGRDLSLEYQPLAETQGDFTGIDHTDPASSGAAGDEWRQGSSVPSESTPVMELADPGESDQAGEDPDTGDAMIAATIGERAFQPTGTEKTDAQAAGVDDEKQAEAGKKAAEKAQKENAKEKGSK